MILHELTVDLKSHAYPIYIGENILNSSALFAKHVTGKQIMIITNNTVAKLYLDLLKNALIHYQCDYLILPDGEQYKNLKTWEQILNTLAECKHHRDSTVIALGGGVIGDMSGFASACYQRGIDFIQVPTTLLAQVDASIGGKTGVNHPRGKNLVGAFHQPNAVMIDLITLKTLSRREFNAGLAEIIKAALIEDKNFFAWLEMHIDEIIQLEKKALANAIYQACSIKRNIVIADEKEKNIRALLNLGHTFGHAIEHILKYGTWLHGEAVALGLVLCAKLSVQMGYLSTEESLRIEKLLERIGLPTHLPPEISLEQLIDSIQMDKKIKDAHWRFILLKGIGDAFISDEVKAKDLQSLFSTK